MKKKIVFLGVVLAALISITQVNREQQKMNDLMLDNIEAIAQGEVIVEAICAGSYPVCIVYPHGFFIYGTRLA